MSWWPAGWAPSLPRTMRGGPSIRDDLVAGAVLTGLLVPAGMGYAEAAGLPAVTGLHATIVSLVVYALVGPSRVLILGPDSSLTPIIAAIVAPIVLSGSGEAIATAGLLAVMMGLLLILAGFLRLGMLADLLSKPIRVGYLNGIALFLVISQLAKLSGFSVEADGVVATVDAFVTGVRDGQVVVEALVIGLASLVLMAVLRVVAPGVPALLVAVVGGIVVVAVLGLSDQLPVVGRMPRSLPTPSIGSLDWNDVVDLLPGALGLALIASADTGVLSRSLSSKIGEAADQSHEMAALGAANVATGLLGGFPVSASSSRTPVALRSGARTQITGLTGAGLVLALLLAAPGVTADLPSSVLAAVVMVAAASLAEPGQMLWLWRVRRVEGALSLVALLGVVFAGPVEGIGIAILLSLVMFLLREWRPYGTELVRVPMLKGYHDVYRHPEGERIPGLVIVRFDAPLFFANAELFSNFVRGKVRGGSRPTEWVLIAAEPITDIDTTAAEDLVRLDEELSADGVRLVFAELKGPAKDRLGDYGELSRFEGRLFPTIGTAVSAFVKATGSDWTDWTDRGSADGAGGGDGVDGGAS